ncbi:hypothetical protein AGMMS49990_07030 [Endomicrobiia bacterium]|nr:hypothetical protein AGMMS49990_07030 [Endomicrobiia bacterium]
MQGKKPTKPMTCLTEGKEEAGKPKAQNESGDSFNTNTINGQEILT